jgi:hypothetical protein
MEYIMTQTHSIENSPAANSIYPKDGVSCFEDTCVQLKVQFCE